MATLEERFWAKVREEGECWVWTAAHNGIYPVCWNGERQVYAHRWAYESMVAPIPDGLDIDHLCRNKMCVNPYHLEPVTRQVNILRAHRDAPRPPAAYCKRNHEFSAENTITAPNGRRKCRTCTNDRQRMRYHERRRRERGAA